MRRELVTTTYLEMRNPTQLRCAREPASAAQVLRAEIPSPTLNRYLYSAVGGDWHWTDRLSWNYARWQQYLDRPQIQTWVMYVRGTPAGYVELEAQDDGDVEIAYFGLIREFIGQGLGGYLLSIGIEKAWTMNGAVPTRHPNEVRWEREGPHTPAEPADIETVTLAPKLTSSNGASRVQRVWVHTCTLDGAQALANYLARGMTVYKIESVERDVHDTPGPWPGAR